MEMFLRESFGKSDQYYQGRLCWRGQEWQEVPFTLNTPPLLFYEGALSGVVDRLVQANFSGCKPQTPNLAWYNYETYIQNIVLL